MNKKLLLAQTDLAFRRLKKDKKAWQQELEEREEWGFLNDELKNEYEITRPCLVISHDN